MSEHYYINIYKPRKSPSMWRYYAKRTIIRKNDYSIEVTLLTDGTWGDGGLDIAMFRTMKEAKAAAEKSLEGYADHV